jgi:hypothetical protein
MARWFDRNLDETAWGRGVISAGGAIYVLLAATLWMRPAVYPFQVWGGLLVAATAGVAGVLGAGVAALSRRRWLARQAPAGSKSVLALAKILALLLPGVVVGIVVILLLRAGYLGYAMTHSTRVIWLRGAV